MPTKIHRGGRSPVEIGKKFAIPPNLHYNIYIGCSASVCKADLREKTPAPIRDSAMNKTEKIVLDRFKALLSERIGLHRLILFGSRARGDADPDSDLDVLVVLDSQPTDSGRDLISDCAWEAGFDYGLIVVPIVFTRREWEEGPERYSLLSQAVQAEGIPI